MFDYRWYYEFGVLGLGFCFFGFLGVVVSFKCFEYWRVKVYVENFRLRTFVDVCISVEFELLEKCLRFFDLGAGLVSVL